MAEYEKKVRDILKKMAVTSCGMVEGIMTFGLAPS
jgi:hypothetical protein